MSKELPEGALIPIDFEGESIPSEIYWLELLPVFCTGINKELYDWFLDLHYCGGNTRSLDSKSIILHCITTKDIIERNHERIQEELLSRVPWPEPIEIIENWLIGLNEMARIANTKAHCTWTRKEVNDSNIDKLGRFKKYLEGLEES